MLESAKEKRKNVQIGATMNEYFVAGGTYTSLEGEERFDLVCPGPGEPPYVLIDGVMDYFRVIWQSAHLYRVEGDYSLTLMAPSPEALSWGVKAPEIVTPNASLLQHLQKVICRHGPESTRSCQSWRPN
jgi:hypothetical protein